MEVSVGPNEHGAQHQAPPVSGENDNLDINFFGAMKQPIARKPSHSSNANNSARVLKDAKITPPINE